MAILVNHFAECYSTSDEAAAFALVAVFYIVSDAIDTGSGRYIFAKRLVCRPADALEELEHLYMIGWRRMPKQFRLMVNEEHHESLEEVELLATTERGTSRHQ